MKKILFIFICVFILTSCSTNTDNFSPQGFDIIDSLGKYSDPSILFYTDNRIYFYEISEAEDENDATFTLYEQDLSRNRTKRLGNISDFFMSMDSVVLLEDGFAFTICTIKEDRLYNNLYYYTNGNLINIYSRNSNIPMSFVNKTTEEELILFSPNSMTKERDEYYKYDIIKIDLNNNTNREIKSFQYNITMQKGEIVPAIDVDNGIIYAFKNSAEGLNNSYSICSFDLDGRMLDEYNVDIQDFLYLEPASSSYDSVFKIECFEDNLFVLQTLNSRIIIFEKRNNKLVRVDAPDGLSAFPEGYKIAKYCENGSDKIYFINMFNDNIIRFDTLSKEFMELNISKNHVESHIDSITINLDGNILLDMDNHFYISKENDYKFIEKHPSPSTNQKEHTSPSQNKDSDEFEGEESLPGLDEEADMESPKVSERPKYVLEPIAEKRYEKNDRFIEFNDMPENDAETLACYNLMYKITGNYSKRISEFLYNIPANDYDEDATAESSYEWIKVAQVNTMSFDELKESDNYADLFQQLLYNLAPNMEIDDYVKLILNNGCAVVYIIYSDKYTEKAALELPQNPDGEHEEYYLLVPDENNQLRIFDSTEYYLLFNIYNKDNVPNALKVN